MLGFAIPHSPGWRQNLQDHISLGNEVGSHEVKSFAFSGTLLGSLLLRLTALRYLSVILTFTVVIIIFPLVLPGKWEVLRWGSCWWRHWPKIKKSISYSWLKSLQTSWYKKTEAVAGWQLFAQEVFWKILLGLCTATANSVCLFTQLNFQR